MTKGEHGKHWSGGERGAYPSQKSLLPAATSFTKQLARVIVMQLNPSRLRRFRGRRYPRDAFPLHGTRKYHFCGSAPLHLG